MPVIKNTLTLKDLPLPVQQKSGWLSDEKSQNQSEQALDQSFHPRITIITPSYNQGQFIEETIRSVLLQGYPNLEFIIIDGGSTDNTIEIIKKYEKYLAYWVSESDRGQTHAINKGLALSTGEIWSYLNSDDLLCPGALHKVAEAFKNQDIAWVGAVSSIIDGNGIVDYIKPQIPPNKKDYLFSWTREIQYVFPCSNVSFMRKEILDKCGLFDETLHFCMDIEYYVRAVMQGNYLPYFIPDVLGQWRWHDKSKTLNAAGAYGFFEDEILIATKYLPYLEPLERREMQKHLLYHRKFLSPRKAVYFLQQGDKKKALHELIMGIIRNPSLLLFRPWVGAIKRLLINI